MPKAPTTSSYRNVLEALISRVDQGRVPHGAFMPTERELQEEFGVSRTTVRRALFALIEAGYGENVPNRGVIARKVERTGSKAIAFIDGSTVVLRSMFRSMATAFLRKGYHLVHIDSEVLGLETSIKFAVDKGCEGAFVWPFEGFPDVAYLNKVGRDLPIVALDHRLRGFRTDLITFDYFEMARVATMELASQGKRRIAITGMYDMLETTHERFAGYMRGCFESGLQPHAIDYVFSVTSGQGDSDYRHLYSRLISEDRPDALLILQDDFAVEALQTIQAAGLSIPDDVAVATIGDDLILSVDGKRITAVHCDWNDFSQHAIEVMLQRIKDPSGPKMTRLARHQLRSQEASSWGYSPSSAGLNTLIAGSDRPRRPTMR
jgi:DNA-binding LacI/PurR family transcriptional regulator